MIQSVLSVLQENIMYYNFPYLDTSQISMLNLGESLVDYKVDTQQTSRLNNYSNTDSFFVSQIVQARK